MAIALLAGLYVLDMVATLLLIPELKGVALGKGLLRRGAGRRFRQRAGDDAQRGVLRTGFVGEAGR